MIKKTINKLIPFVLSLFLCCMVAIFSSANAKVPKDVYLGIDIGGQSVKLGVVDSVGKLLEESKIPTDINATPEQVVESIFNAVAKFNAYSKVKYIGVGVPGAIDADNGIVRYIPQLSKWKNVPLKKLLEQKMGDKEIYIDNDANTASLGAFWLDADGKSDNLICITLGTGVGAGIVLNKKLYIGSSGSAGELGHITIDPDKNAPKCNCGSKGCLEAFIGEKQFLLTVNKYLTSHPSAIINDLLVKGNSPLLNCKVLFDAAEKGDKTAKELWDYYGEKLGILLADTINAFNPDVIVLCGGISQSAKYFMPSALSEAKKRSFSSAFDTCKIKITSSTNKLGVIGAAILAKQNAPE
jgi:glucokinase